MSCKADASRGTGNVCARNTEEHSGSTIEIVQLLARLLVPHVAEELRRSSADDWVDQTTSPLGRRRHCELARRSAFPAFRDGRRWRARRADVDAYITSMRRGSVPCGAPSHDATSPGESDVRALLAEVGLDLAPPAGRRTRR